jgi:hypothetical protein
MYYRLKQTLVQAGWTVVKSSDGVTTDATGNYLNDRITGGYGTGANNLNNSGAWYVVKAPAAVSGMTRQFCIQRRSGASSNLFDIYYSASAGFTGGSLTTAPTATDIQTVLSNTSSAGAANYRFSIGADNAAPYGFYMFNFVSGGASNPLHAFVMDPLASGTYNASDTDPYIIYATSTSTFLAAGIGSETASTGPLSYYKKGLTGESFVLTPGNLYYDASRLVIPGGLPANPYSTKDNIYPIPYMRRSGLAVPNGFKGIGTIMKWSGSTRNVGDTLSVSANGAKDYIVAGNVALPWNGTTPTV